MSVLKKNIKLHHFTAPTADTGTAGTGTKEGGEQIKIPFYSEVFVLFTLTVKWFRNICFSGLTACSDLDELKNHLTFILDEGPLDETEIKKSAEVLLGTINAYCILEEALKDDSFQGFDEGEFYYANKAVSDVTIAEKAYILALKIAEEYPVMKPFLEYFE